MYLLIVNWFETGMFAFPVACHSWAELEYAANYWSNLTINGKQRYSVEKYNLIAA